MYQGQLQITDVDMNLLTKARTGPLGRYFERLVGCVFKHCPEIEAAHFNVPVREGVLTKGEFDLLYKWKGVWHHIEMATKFYLGQGDLSNVNNWHGPALRDNLGRKWRHMKTHQLVLPETSAGQRVLSALGIDCVVSEPLILGRLFHPYDIWVSDQLRVPEEVADTHSNGWWIRTSAISKLQGQAWCRLTKPDWLSPVIGNLVQQTSEPDISNLDRPIQFAVLESSQKDDIKEINRGFIVPDTWGQDIPIN